MRMRKGQIIVFTEGEYSDYEMWRFAKVIKDFDLKQMKKEFAPLVKNKIKGWRNFFECEEQAITNAFTCFLVGKGLVEGFDACECWCGSYSEFDTKCERDRFF